MFGISGKRLQDPAGTSTIDILSIGATIQKATLDGIVVLDRPHNEEQARDADKHGYFNCNLFLGNRNSDPAEFEGFPGLWLPENEPARRNNLHGPRHVYAAPWQDPIVARSSKRSSVTYNLRVNQETVRSTCGFPFDIDMSVMYQLVGKNVLKKDVWVENKGETAAPISYVWHAYIPADLIGDAPNRRVDDLELQLPAASVIDVNERMIPTGKHRVSDHQGTMYDFRNPRRIGNMQLDNGFTDLNFNEGMAETVIINHAQEARVRCRQSKSLPYLQVYSADTLPEADGRRRKVLAVEQMSASADSLRAGEAGGLVLLQPEETWHGSIEIIAEHLK